jgi:hypothetical protein
VVRVLAGSEAEHPAGDPQNYTGILQADGYAGFNKLYETGRIMEAASIEALEQNVILLFPA